VIRGKIELVDGDVNKWKGLDAMIDQLEDEPEPVKSDMRTKTVPFEVVQIWKLHIDEVSGKEGT
jgi:hypothetical protein